MNKPLLAITMGDPAGIGPEVIVKALHSNKNRTDYNLLILGESQILIDIANQYSIPVSIDGYESLDKVSFSPGKISVLDCQKLNRNQFQMAIANPDSGDFAYQLIVQAVDLALHKKIDAIITAPICKEALHMAGHFYDGHTGLLAHLTNTRKYRMLFAAERLKILHVTAHLPLVEACQTLTSDMVYETIALGHQHLERLGIKSPKIAVCGLNPHAGENGIFGREDLDVILPAVKKAKTDGIQVEGPLPADTTFLQAFNGIFDLVIAQYHDQGHVPGKLVAFDTAVNVTVGLPIIRTSVDHGTAFDIAGQGLAKSNNLNCAINYAYQLVKNR